MACEGSNYRVRGSVPGLVWGLQKVEVKSLRFKGF